MAAHDQATGDLCLRLHITNPLPADATVMQAASVPFFNVALKPSKETPTGSIQCFSNTKECWRIMPAWRDTLVVCQPGSQAAIHTSCPW